MLLIKFDAGEKFFFFQDFKISFELRCKAFSQKKKPKNPENRGNNSQFYNQEPDPNPNFRKNWTLIYCTLVNNRTLCFF